MPLGILLDCAHPMSLLPQLSAQAPCLPDSAVDELRKDVRVRLLYLFPENPDLSGLLSTAAGVGQLIDLSPIEAAHLINEARRVIYKVYIDEMNWQFGDNTPSCIQRVKAHSIVGSILAAKNKKPGEGLNIELPTCRENAVEQNEDESPLEPVECQSPVPWLSEDSKSEKEDEEKVANSSPESTTPRACSPVSRRGSVVSTASTASIASSSFSFESSSSLQVPTRRHTPSPTPPPRRPSFLKNAVLEANGVADKFDDHAVWCLAVVDDERFDTKRRQINLSPRRRRLSDATAHTEKNVVLLHSRVVGCIRILVRENCPDQQLEIEGYLSEKRNADLLRRLQGMGNSNNPMQRLQFQRLVEINRLAILKEYRGLSLSDDLFGMICIYASERSSSIICSSSFKSGHDKFKRLGKYCTEMGELKYEDHDPHPCGVVVLQLPVLLLLNRVARYVLFVVPRRYWRYLHYPKRFAMGVLAVFLLIALIMFLYSVLVSHGGIQF